MNNLIIIALVAIAIFFLIRILTMRQTVDVPVAYAGSANGKSAVKKLPAHKNKTIYTEGENIIDLDGFSKFIVCGNSLEPVGLLPDTLVFTKSDTNLDIKAAEGKFVVFRYDLDRQKAEHPDVIIEDGAHKARKMIAVMKSSLDKDDFISEIKNIIHDDAYEEVSDKIWKKYEFASDFYKNDSSLILSLTYRDGKYKSYSFHSPRFLAGVVQYRSVS